MDNEDTGTCSPPTYPRAAIACQPETAGLDSPADMELISQMLECSRENLHELLEHRYRDRSKVLKKIMHLLIDELASFRHPENYTVKELFSQLLVTELIKMKYYTWGHWLVGPRRVCCRQSFMIIKIMFGHYENCPGIDTFLVSEDFESLRDYLHPTGLALLRCYWQHDFVREITAVEAHRAQDACHVQLPFKDKTHLATITKKGYVGMLHGNIYARRFVLALNQYFMENIWGCIRLG